MDYEQIIRLEKENERSIYLYLLPNSGWIAYGRSAMLLYSRMPNMLHRKMIICLSDSSEVKIDTTLIDQCSLDGILYNIKQEKLSLEVIEEESRVTITLDR